MKNLSCLLLFISFIGCDIATENAQEIVDQAIMVSGGENYENTEIEFIFRDREYGYKKVEGRFEYVRLFKDSTDVIRDVLTNDGFTREKNGQRVEVVDTMAAKYTRSINSVIYFALLPYPLNDPAAYKMYVGRKEIKGTEYHKIKVTFDLNEGGEDHEDVFYYWIDIENHKVDYLAYIYKTDGGGTRFREGYNQRYVGDVRFMDYVNYKPTGEINLEDIDDAFINGELEELSKIELEEIKVNPL